MTIKEARESKDFKAAMEKIRSYKKGFRFTIEFSNIPIEKANGLKLLLNDAVNAGLLDGVSMGVALNGELAEATFVRL